MNYQSPGVYLDEVDSGARPIEGVGTAIAAFVGLAEKGPFNNPILRVAASAVLVLVVVLAVRKRMSA